MKPPTDGTASEDFGPLPSVDTTNRHAVDQLLRHHGFQIHERRGSNEPVWVRGGKVYRQGVAVEMVRRKGKQS